jgi:hypothetical protein
MNIKPGDKFPVSGFSVKTVSRGLYTCLHKTIIRHQNENPTVNLLTPSKYFIAEYE